jgi:regulator of sirC expression with transglutaminase-like and TPR domain
MLFNLRGTYIAREAWNETLATLDHLRALQPSVAEHSRDMGLAYLRKSEPRKAVEMLEQYLVLKPDAADVESIRNSLAPLIDRLARLN